MFEYTLEFYTIDRTGCMVRPCLVAACVVYGGGCTKKSALINNYPCVTYVVHKLPALLSHLNPNFNLVS